MKEDFLYYLWQYQQFDKAELRTSAGEPVAVLRTGTRNTDAGPDFGMAKLHIGDVEWAGSVEMHLKASDWNRHQHQTDPKYGNVILHVVWEEDEQVLRPDQTPMPTLELKDRAFPMAQAKYELLLTEKPGIPCNPFFRQVPELTKLSMLDRALHERLATRTQMLDELVQKEGQNWETTSYRWLFRAFGFKINSEAMYLLSGAVPLPVVQKHLDSVLQLEALLLGQAGLLDVPEPDPYIARLQKEHAHLSNKYGLQANRLTASQWNFFRLRPANFPTIRIGQLAAFLAATPHIRQALLETPDVKAYHRMFAVRQSEYWQQHYVAGKPAKSPIAGLGKSSVHNLLINGVVPLLAAYAYYKGDEACTEKAIELLETLPGEKNSITAIYEQLGLQNKAAADSQALLHLYRNYCQPVRCLDCAIGVKVLKGNL